ncbi:hypothetical protein [Burkholderia sp. LMG 32019]|uniref:hypothetical protein n=1 Tax=Burkholderia sp. LMG 32019 TaxID=3158173 RepID=UPI003C2AE403
MIAYQESETMWAAIGPLTDVTPPLLSDRISTAQEQSGSAIVARNDAGQWSIYGIHVGGRAAANIGCRSNEMVRANMVGWIDGRTADDFATIADEWIRRRNWPESGRSRSNALYQSCRATPVAHRAAFQFRS